uniref:Uncharacterized protein n=1 Tax=Triticum urartu TaxID=4572 RepID=A0A8R7K0P4_TRIUA
MYTSVSRNCNVARHAPEGFRRRRRQADDHRGADRPHVVVPGLDATDQEMDDRGDAHLHAHLAVGAVVLELPRGPVGHRRRPRHGAHLEPRLVPAGLVEVRHVGDSQLRRHLARAVVHVDGDRLVAHGHAPVRVVGREGEVEGGVERGAAAPAGRRGDVEAPHGGARDAVLDGLGADDEPEDEDDEAGEEHGDDQRGHDAAEHGHPPGAPRRRRHRGAHRSCARR